MEDNDFGFTALDNDEILETIQNKDTLYDTHKVQEILWDLYDIINPLLQNLKLNPEKPNIYWPNRVEKIEAFQNKLRNYIETI